MALNGLLAGLVGITANCDTVSNVEALIIGLVSGILVVLGVKLLDYLKIDDPVGAWPVHGLNGLWGGIATGIIGTDKNLGVQILGSLALWVFASMFILFLIQKYTIGIRVSRDEELKGLDIGEHGEEAYRGVIHEVNLLNKTVLQIAVNEDYVQPTINAIIEGARTGNIGDEKIFITELVDVIRIRTGERGSYAIG